MADEIIPGYTIRFATRDDIEVVAEMITTTFLGHTEYGDWTRQLMNGIHPDGNPGHTIVAVENETGAIVSAIPCSFQTFSYAGIPMPVLIMQIVATLPEHREKGLLRAQVNALLGLAARGGAQALLVLGISGFYPKLGFLPLLPSMGGKEYSALSLQHWLAGCSEQPDTHTITLRPAQVADLPFLARVSTQAARRYLVSTPYTERYWQWMAFDYFPQNRDDVRVIVQANGEAGGSALGMLIIASGEGETRAIYNLELAEGVSWLEILPPVIRCLLETRGAALESLCFALGKIHPAYPFLADVQQRDVRSTMTYVRMIDLVGFLRYIAPLLEERIARSSICGYTRVVRIELYYRKEGIVLTFEKGKLVDVSSRVIEGYQLVCDRAEIEMPESAFISLLMGQVSADELAVMLREVNTWNGEDGLAAEFRVLLNVLFPKQDSLLSPCN